MAAVGQDGSVFPPLKGAVMFEARYKEHRDRFAESLRRRIGAEDVALLAYLDSLLAVAYSCGRTDATQSIAKKWAEADLPVPVPVPVPTPPAKEET